MSPMSPGLQHPFVYGTFRWIGPPKLPFMGIGAQGGLAGLQRIGGPREPDIAIEILREFSSTELVGKVHVRVLHHSWVPLQVDDLRSQSWFVGYEEYRKSFVFDMRGAGPWEVLYFRDESDESGLYIAVAIRSLAETPDWVVSQRRRDG